MENMSNLDERLKINEKLLSIHAINPFITNISSPRAIMMGSHISQMITLPNADERIIQTGLEKQLGENTFSKKLENDSRIINIIKRYSGLDNNSVNTTTELTVIYEDLVTGEIDYINVPNYFSLHQYFGFMYKWNEETLSSITANTILPKDTILADSPSVRENNSYAFGVNANIALLTMPEVAEDGVIISDEMAEKFAYDTIETRVVEFGTDSFALNMYGDEDNYKPFPEIGEKINDDGVVMVLREYDPLLAPSLTSKKDVLEFDPTFDKAIYTKGPGGEIIDIKVYKSPAFKKELYQGTEEIIDKYAKGLVKYYKDILDTYTKLSKEHYAKFRNSNLPISEKLNKLIIDS